MTIQALNSQYKPALCHTSQYFQSLKLQKAITFMKEKETQFISTLQWLHGNTLICTYKNVSENNFTLLKMKYLASNSCFMYVFQTFLCFQVKREHELSQKKIKQLIACRFLEGQFEKYVHFVTKHDQFFCTTLSPSPNEAVT